jgi:hypothetical protein
LDDFCDTPDSLGVGASERFRDWRIHPYFARRSSHCTGGGSRSETITSPKKVSFIMFPIPSSLCCGEPCAVGVQGV